MSSMDSLPVRGTAIIFGEAALPDIHDPAALVRSSSFPLAHRLDAHGTRV
jgi:hypothetical protein